MEETKVYERDFSSELQFSTARSSGPGGQHVNKVNTKVNLRFDVGASSLLTEAEKQVLMDKLSNKISKEQILAVSAEDKRSQLQNKQQAIARFYELLRKAFTTRKKRKASRPSAVAIEKRLKEKQKHAEKKKLRRGLDL